MDALTDLEERLESHIHSPAVEAELRQDNEMFVDEALPGLLTPPDSLLMTGSSLGADVERRLDEIPNRWKLEYLEYIIEAYAGRFYESWWRRMIRKLRPKKT